jgi:hypothetical protein
MILTEVQSNERIYSLNHESFHPSNMSLLKRKVEDANLTTEGASPEKKSKQSKEVPETNQHEELRLPEPRAGPTDWSFWLLPDRILVSAYPGHAGDDKMHAQIIHGLVGVARVDTFISLQPLTEVKEKGFRDYEAAARKLCPTLACVRWPIPDTKTIADKQIMEYRDQVLDWLQTTNKVMCIHCWGGRGRSGTLASLILAERFKIVSGRQVLHLHKQLAAARVNPGSRRNARMPLLTRVQHNHVMRFVDASGCLKLPNMFPVKGRLPTEDSDIVVGNFTSSS